MVVLMWFQRFLKITHFVSLSLISSEIDCKKLKVFSQGLKLARKPRDTSHAIMSRAIGAAAAHVNALRNESLSFRGFFVTKNCRRFIRSTTSPTNLITNGLRDRQIHWCDSLNYKFFKKNLSVFPHHCCSEKNPPGCPAKIAKIRNFEPGT